METKPLQGGERSDPFAEVNAPEFLARLLAGGRESQRTFGWLVKVTHDRFLAFARRSLSSLEESREVVQEMYLAVHKGLPKFEGKSKLTTWMYSLLHHKICDCIAEKERSREEMVESHEAQLSTETNVDSWQPLTAWDAPADRVLVRASLETKISEAVSALPVAAREVYHLRDVEGLSGDEAAEALGLSSANVRVQLHRARRLIVEHVQESLRSDVIPGKATR